MIYDHYARRVYSLSVRITHDPATAEDLTQELFLRLWNRAQQFDSNKGSLDVWLLSMARNMAIDHMRSGAAQFAKRLHYSMEHIEKLSYSIWLGEPGSRMHRATSVKRALATLTAHERRLLELAYFDGYSQAEIANLLQKPLGTVKTWIRSALIHLRPAIKGERSPSSNADQVCSLSVST